MLPNLVVLDRCVGMNDNYFHSKYSGCSQLLYIYIYIYTEFQAERESDCDPVERKANRTMR